MIYFRRKSLSYFRYMHKNIRKTTYNQQKPEIQFYCFVLALELEVVGVDHAYNSWQ